MGDGGGDDHAGAQPLHEGLLSLTLGPAPGENDAEIRLFSFHQFIKTQYHDRHITLFRRDHRFRDPVILPGKILHRIFIHM